jgi:hypothetical protein
VPRFYFHVEDGKKIEDHEGTELPDLRSVRVEAVALAGALLRDHAPSWDGTDWTMTVTDEAGAPVFKICFSAETFDPAAQASASISPQPPGSH